LKAVRVFLLWQATASPPPGRSWSFWRQRSTGRCTRRREHRLLQPQTRATFSDEPHPDTQDLALIPINVPGFGRPPRPARSVATSKCARQRKMPSRATVPTATAGAVCVARLATGGAQRFDLCTRWDYTNAALLLPRGKGSVYVVNDAGGNDLTDEPCPPNVSG
jgi:hypothetical protein